jgi:hypothetical protein
MDIVRQSPGIAVLRDDWSPDSPQMKIEIDPDRANIVGITNADVAASTGAAISGQPVGIYKWSAQRWICTSHSQRKSYSGGTKQPDTAKPGPPNSPGIGKVLQLLTAVRDRLGYGVTDLI